MSRRDRLATVVRVAALRESVARGRVAVATVEATDARRRAEAAQAAVAGQLPVGRSGDVVAALEAAQRRAESATLAAGQHAAAVDTRRAELAGWSAAAQRARLLADLAERHRVQREAALESRQQRLVDDLAAGRVAVGE